MRQTESKAILAPVRADGLVAATALAAAQEETATLKAALATSARAEEAAKSMLATAEAAKAELDTAHKALLVDFLRIQGGGKREAAEQAVAELVEANAGGQAAPAVPSAFPECLPRKLPALPAQQAGPNDTNYDAMLELVEQLGKAQQEIKRLEDEAAVATELHKTQLAEMEDRCGMVVQPAGIVRMPRRFNRQKTKSLPTKPAQMRNINTAILPSLGAAAGVARARAPGTTKPSMPDRSQRAREGEPKKKPLPSIYDRNHPFPSPYSVGVSTTAHGTSVTSHGGGGVGRERSIRRSKAKAAESF